MAKPYAKKFYHSKSWRDCRQSFISYRVSIDGGMCQYCGKVTGYIVDHIQEITPSNINDTEITLNHDNCQYLCTPCHNIKTFGTKEKSKYYFDGEGMLHQLPPFADWYF